MRLWWVVIPYFAFVKVYVFFQCPCITFNAYALCTGAKLFPEHDATGLGRSISKASFRTSSMVSTGTNLSSFLASSAMRTGTSRGPQRRRWRRSADALESAGRQCEPWERRSALPAGKPARPALRRAPPPAPQEEGLPHYRSLQDSS